MTIITFIRMADSLIMHADACFRRGSGLMELARKVQPYKNKDGDSAAVADRRITGDSTKNEFR